MITKFNVLLQFMDRQLFLLVLVIYVTRPVEMDQVGTLNFTTFSKFIASQLKVFSGYCNEIYTINEYFYE